MITPGSACCTAVEEALVHRGSRGAGGLAPAARSAARARAPSRRGRRRTQRRRAAPAAPGRRRRAMATSGSALRVSCSASMSMRISLPASASRPAEEQRVGLAELGADGQHHVGRLQRLAAPAAAAGCCRGCSGWPGGSTPLALMVQRLGAPSRSTSARAAAAASGGAAAEHHERARRARAAAPPPARSRPGRGRAGAGAAAPRVGRSSAGAVITSSGISMCTGRGRALSNTAKARASTAGRSAGAQQRVAEGGDAGAPGRCWSGSSCSRPSPMPSSSRALTLEITSIGIESA